MRRMLVALALGALVLFSTSTLADGKGKKPLPSQPPPTPSATTSAPTNQNSTVEDLLAQVQARVNAKRFAEAETLMQSALLALARQTPPDKPRAIKMMLDLGQLQVASGDPAMQARARLVLDAAVAGAQSHYGKKPAAAAVMAIAGNTLARAYFQDYLTLVTGRALEPTREAATRSSIERAQLLFTEAQDLLTSDPGFGPDSPKLLPLIDGRLRLAVGSIGGDDGSLVEQAQGICRKHYSEGDERRVYFESWTILLMAVVPPPPRVRQPQPLQRLVAPDYGGLWITPLPASPDTGIMRGSLCTCPSGPGPGSAIPARWHGLFSSRIARHAANAAPAGPISPGPWVTHKIEVRT